jgi:Zn-dependent membrane protease YugP
MIGLSYLLFFGTLALSLWATWRVRAAYGKYSQVPASVGLTGAEVAYRILARAGIGDVQIAEGNQPMGDHYDPIHKQLVLSPQNFRGASTAAMGVAAHECGHALQHQAAYAPLSWRLASTSMVGFANMAVGILPIFGILTGLLRPMLLILCLGWGVIMLFNLITLPVEYDASARAKRVLREMGLVQNANEAAAVSRVLDAAALTYVAAFITSLGYLLYYLLPLLGGSRRE